MTVTYSVVSISC